MPLGAGRFLSGSAFTFPTNTTSSKGVAASAQFFAIPELASATLLLINGPQTSHIHLAVKQGSKRMLTT